MWGFDNRNELQRGLDKARDVVTDQILNEEGQAARRELSKTKRKSNKARAFSRKNKRRNKRRK